MRKLTLQHSSEGLTSSGQGQALTEPVATTEPRFRLAHCYHLNPANTRAPKIEPAHLLHTQTQA